MGGANDNLGCLKSAEYLHETEWKPLPDMLTPRLIRGTSLEKMTMNIFVGLKFVGLNNARMNMAEISDFVQNSWDC